MLIPQNDIPSLISWDDEERSRTFDGQHNRNEYYDIKSKKNHKVLA
jgi:hypothetical protein